MAPSIDIIEYAKSTVSLSTDISTALIIPRSGRQNAGTTVKMPAITGAAGNNRAYI